MNLKGRVAAKQFATEAAGMLEAASVGRAECIGTVYNSRNRLQRMM